MHKYILLELFGYLIGSQRALELAEVWHFEMVQVSSP